MFKRVLGSDRMVDKLWCQFCEMESVLVVFVIRV